MDEPTEKEIAAMEVFLDMTKVTDILRSDNETLIENFKKREDMGFWSRTYVRTLFADLEARTFQFRRMVIALHTLEKCELKPEEEILLKDETYELDNGKIIRKPAKISTANSFLFAFRMVSILSEHDFTINIGHAEWANFKKALKIRDRLTHPKLALDLEISIDEIKLVIGVADWIDALFKSAATKLSSWFEREF